MNKPDSHGGSLDWTKICEKSSKVITFIDLAGHEKYLKTTVFGMTGHLPDFCMLMVRKGEGEGRWSMYNIHDVPKIFFFFFSFSCKCRNKIHFSLPFQVGSNAGIVGMTKEHLGLALALNVPVFVVVTKIDMCPANILQGKPSGVLFALQYFLIMQKIHQTLSWLLLAYMLFVCIFTC